MGKKLTYDYVCNYFEMNNCRLLEFEYISNSTKMKYVCSCGNEAYITFKKFKDRNQRCMKCSGNIPYTFDEIKVIFEKENYKLLSNEYINVKQKLKYICPNDHMSFTTISNFIRGNRCRKCSGLEKHSQEYVEEYFKSQECELLDKYINSKQHLKYKCLCGNISEISLSNFQRGHRCKKCGIKKKIAENNYNWNPNREEIIENKKFSKSIRSTLRAVLERLELNKDIDTETICGYSVKEFRKHLQKDPNYKHWLKDSYNWHIDHIIPVVEFKRHNILDPKIVNHLSNLQIISEKENREKGDYCTESDFQSYISKFTL